MRNIDRAFEGMPSGGLIVLPELCNVLYFPVVSAKIAAPPEIEEANLVYQALGDAAQRLSSHILVGLYRRDRGRQYNSAVMIGPNGFLLPGVGITSGASRQVYDKVHLCRVRHYGVRFFEDEYFEPGTELMYWDLGFARVGGLICYDRHFAEAWSALVRAGVDLVAIPTASPVGTAPTFHAEIQGMALQHSVFVAIANRRGHEVLPDGSGVDYLGRSAVVGPTGLVLDETGADGSRKFASAPFSKSDVLEAQTGLAIQASRRPDAYEINVSLERPRHSSQLPHTRLEH